MGVRDARPRSLTELLLETRFCFSVGKAVFLMPKGSTLALPYGGNAVLLDLLVVPFIRYRNKKKRINRTN